MEEESEEEMEERSFIPSAVSEPRWALHMCDNMCTGEGFKFFELAAIVQEKRRCSSYDQLVQAVLQCKAAEAR